MSNRTGRRPSLRLHQACARIGGAIADLLESTGLKQLGSADDAPAFLRGLVNVAGEDETGRADVEPFDRLVSAFGLNEREQALMFLAGFPEEHEGYATILRALNPRSEPRATIGLAAQLLTSGQSDRDMLRALVEHGPLFRTGIISSPSEGPFFERQLTPMEGLWSVLHGLDVWPRALRPGRTAANASGLRQWLDEPQVLMARIAIADSEPRIVLVTADSEEIALHRALLIVQDAGRESACLPLWTGHQPDMEQLVTVHCVARGVLPVLHGAAPETGFAVTPSLPDFPGPIVVATRRGAVRLQGSRPAVHVDVERTTPAMRREAWRTLMPELDDSLDAVASRYTLDPAQIAAVAGDIRSLDALLPEAPAADKLSASVRVRSNLALGGGFNWVRPNAEWQQLVLPPDRLALVEEALNRLRHQKRVFDEWKFLEGRTGARGVRMLFSGPPGTGKTWCAEVMAATLGVDLLVVDIPRVVSKWLGETERNLAEVFDAAERAQAVLLFDEADAFFGRRTEISDAHDRYANFETAFLLSRIDRFDGLAILSTNLRQNIDPAFLRRLEFIIDFDEPAARERAALWYCHLPAGITLADDVRIGELASLYALVGGLIRNAAVAAAFLAAGDGSTTITREHFLRAIAREYEKAGKAFPGVPAGVNA